MAIQTNEPTMDPIIVIPKRTVQAKNEHVWMTQPDPTNTQTPASNTVITERDTMGSACDANTPEECFLQLNDKVMLNVISNFSNNQINLVKGKLKNQT